MIGFFAKKTKKDEGAQEKARAHLFISGRVQGVRFREGVCKKAKEFYVFGWIRNLPDGRVEAIYEGEKDGVRKLIYWSKRGPIFAKVVNLEIIQEEYKGEFNNFEKRYLI